MRTSIVGLLPTDVEQSAANICRLTHYDPRCVGSCVIISELIMLIILESVHKKCIKTPQNRVKIDCFR